MAINDLINKAKSFARKNPDKAKSVIEKIETTVDQKTQGKYSDQITKAGDAVGGALGVERSEGGDAAADAKPAEGQAAESAQETAQESAPEAKPADGADEPKGE